MGPCGKKMKVENIHSDHQRHTWTLMQFFKPLAAENLLVQSYKTSEYSNAERRRREKKKIKKNAPAHSSQATEDTASANHFEIPAISAFPTEKEKHWKLTSVSRRLPANKQT